MTLTLTPLVLGVYLLLVGVSTLGWIVISATVLGVLALVAGILVLLDAYHPIAIWRRTPPQA